MTWERTGGGCHLLTDVPHPCDDDYENAETGERVRFFSTKEAHFAMPRTVERLAEVHDGEGVRDLVKIMEEARITGIERQ